jgi:hypothetical protein
MKTGFKAQTHHIKEREKRVQTLYTKKGGKENTITR